MASQPKGFSQVPKFYIAGPFFNDVQAATVAAIENAMTERKINFFSPRLLGENASGGPLTLDISQKIFAKDIGGIRECDAMIAVLDWAMPEGKSICAVVNPRYEKYLDIKDPILKAEICSPPLNIPDSGTVFEMGFAFCLDMCVKTMPIIGFTNRDPEKDGINLMLTRSTAGILHGWSALEQFMPGGGVLNWGVVQPWRGKNR